MVAYTREDVLGLLDRCAEEYVFPMLDNGYVYPADARLTAYRDEARWALIIEVLGFNPRAGGHNGISDTLYCFGNCLPPAPSGIFPAGALADDVFVTGDGPEDPTFEEEFGEHVRESARMVCVRGRMVPLNLRPEILRDKGIEPEEPPKVHGAELLRYLVTEHRELLLATDRELRRWIPPGLPLVLRLDEWHHPDIAGGEQPGGSPTFRMVADVLVSGDPSRYHPTYAPNTHWSNWPEGGSL